ncbi:MAG: alkaline phosphatase family protein [Burkholderiaceae bacterium]
MSPPPLPEPPHAIGAAASILNLAAALAARFGAPAGASPLAEPRLRAALASARSVVLVVFDGFGVRQLDDHVSSGALADCRLSTLSSVFPSSTAPAMTSFATALPPAMHGNPGWFVWSSAQHCMVRSLPLDVRGDPRTPVAAASLWSWQPWPAASRSPCLAWLPADIAESRYSQYAYAGSTRIGYEDPQQIIDALADALRATPGGLFAQVYLPQFDAISHVFGCRSPRAANVASGFDRWFEALADRLRAFDVLLLATADHGFIDIAPQDQHHLADHPSLAACLGRPLAGEPRVPFCDVLPGREDEFADGVRQAFADAFDVYPSGELLAAGWFGPSTPPASASDSASASASASASVSASAASAASSAAAGILGDRLGTHLLIPRGNAVLIDQVEGEKPLSMIGMHGGPSDDEMRVPLMAAYRGRPLA